MNQFRSTFSLGALTLGFLICNLLPSSNAFAQLQKAVTLVKGVVNSSDGSILPDASVSFFNGTEKVFSTKSNSEGKFNAVLKPGITYRVGLSHTTHLYKEENMVISSEEKSRDVNWSMKPFQPNQLFELSEKVFAPKGSTILTPALATLSDVANTIKYNPKLVAEITVYPDATPKNKKDVSQQTLVSSRSSAITSFFQSKGVPFKNIVINQEVTAPGKGQFAAATTTSGKKKKKGSATAAPAASSAPVQYIDIRIKSSS